MEDSTEKIIRIEAPLIDKREVARLCQAGAEELFCGIEITNWRRHFEGFAINQRTSYANFSKMEDLAEAINIAHKYNAKVHVAINAFFYMEEQYKMAVKLVNDILNIKADGFIFADLGLLLSIDKRLLINKDVIIGTDGVVFNLAAVNFYKSLGATRIIFPRSMTLREMGEVVKKDDYMEYEVFIINDLCFFEDGLCSYCKDNSGEAKKIGRTENVNFFSRFRLPIRGYYGGCRTIFKRRRISAIDGKRFDNIKKSPIGFTFWDKKHINGCGACAIYNFKKMGIRSLKVLDRNLPIEVRAKSTLFIKDCLHLLNNGNVSKAEYIEKSKDLFKKTFKVKCNRYDCYYPSLFLHAVEQA